jgi:glycosyltransferase involved in cell wall biosynthesis
VGATVTLDTVMFVAPYFPPRLGGAEEYVSNLVQHLLSADLIGRAVVVTTTAVDPATVTDERLTFHRLPVDLTVSATPVGFGWPYRLAQLIRREQPDLVNAHTPVPVLADVAAAVSGRRPFVLTYHAGPMRKGHPVVDLALRAYESSVLTGTAARAEDVICSSDYVRQALYSSFSANPRVIRPGVDATRFTATPSPGGRRVAFVGALRSSTRYKNLDTLIEAAALLRAQGRPIEVVVAGDGDLRQHYEDLAQAAGVGQDLDFVGQVRGDALVAVYQRSDLLVQPSTYDSLPLTLVEAMACARPVVASRVGGIAEVVADGQTGRLVTPRDAAGLAAGIDEVLCDRGLATRWGQAGRAVVERTLTWPTQAAATADIFEAAVGRNRARRSGGGLPANGKARVAVVASSYAPRIGGLETYARRVVREVQASPDLEPVVLTTRPGVRTTHRLQDGVRVVRLGSWGRLSNTPLSPLWPWQLRHQLRRHRIDLVNTHAPVPGLADVAAFAAGRRPVVATYHAGSMVKGNPRVDWLLRAYERFVLPRVFTRAAGLVAVSPVSLAWGTGRAELIPPGVDLTQFSPGPRADGDPHPPTLLYVGRLEQTSAWKGVDVLVRALALLRQQFPDVRLHLVGEGDAVAALQHLAGSLGVGDAAHDMGKHSGAELVEQYRAADIVVLPSLTAAESFGIVLIEAMACGKPVIGSDVGGIPFVVTDDETGLLVPPGDEVALAKACARLLSDPEAAAALAARGERSVRERFSWQVGMEHTMTLFRTALSLRRTGVDESSERG